ncbi:MAG: response regulator [Desulfobacterales bacterium]|nr:response regulator [Desulfobacterales bacterium]
MKPDRSQKQVLVVDNHPLMLTYMRRLLEKRGDDVLTAEDGLSALKILDEHQPDVIFVDQVMPNISGDKLCRIIRTRPNLKDACVIILSAIAAEADFNFVEFGANYCIAKGPFDKMSTHILALLYRLDAEGECGTSDRVIGREDVYYRQISRELLYSKKHADVILNHLSEGVLELTLGGEIVYTNPTALQMFDAAEEVLLGSPFQGLFSGKERQRIEAMLEQVADAGSASTGETPIEIKNRQVRLDLIRIDDQAHQAITVILNDAGLDKRQAAEFRAGEEGYRPAPEKLKDLHHPALSKEELVRSERLATAGQLAAAIANEVESPLQTIDSIFRSQAIHHQVDESLASDLKMVEDAVDRMRDTVSKLLSLGRPGEKERQKVEVNRIVEEVVSRVQDELQAAKVTLALKLSPGLPAIDASFRQMGQAVESLIRNAVEALSGGSDTKESGSRRAPARQLTIRTDRSGGYVRIRVADNGPGIVEEDLQRIFDPFYTQKKSKWIGAGLSISHRIVEAHGGRFFAENRSEGGAQFSILIPFA